jgi:hypothetical protein
MAGEVEKIEADVEGHHHGASGHEAAHGAADEHKGPPGKPDAADPAKAKKRREYLIIAATIVGVILTFILYERSKNTSSTSATTPAAGTTGTVAGQATDPNAEAGVQGLAQAFNALTAQDSANQAANQSAQAGLQSLLGSLGAEVTSLQSQVNGIPQAYAPPPGGVPSSTSGPPNLGSALSAQLAANGETITQVVADAKGGWLYLTNKGGVYNAGGSPNYGSYLGLTPAQQNQVGGFASITPLASGGYTETSAQGATYSFGPGPGQTNLTGAP